MCSCRAWTLVSDSLLQQMGRSDPFKLQSNQSRLRAGFEMRISIGLNEFEFDFVVPALMLQ